jgi:hypothetical protein
MHDIEELRAIISILRRQAEETNGSQRQRKLLALAAKWEATADESDGTWRHLDLFRKPDITK